MIFEITEKYFSQKNRPKNLFPSEIFFIKKNSREKYFGWGNKVSEAQFRINNSKNVEIKYV